MPRQRFVSVVLEPLPDGSELETAAFRSLEEKLEAADPDDAALEEAAKRFEAVDARPAWLGRAVRWGLLAGAVAMAFWPATIRTEWEMAYGARILDREGFFSFGGGAVSSKSERKRHVDFLFPEATREQKMLLSSTTPEEAGDDWRSLDPDDPALYYRYARECLELPPDFLATAERLDPDNGYARATKAVRILHERKALKRKRKSSPRGRLASLPAMKRPLATYEVKDEAAFREALELWNEATKKRRFDGRQAEFRVRCVERGADSPPVPYTIRQVQFVWLGGRMFPANHTILQRHIGDLICVQADRLKEADDKEGLAALARQWLDWMPREIADSSNLLHCLVSRANIESSGRHLLAACRELGLEEEARRIEPPVRTACEMRNARDRVTGQDRDAISLRGGLIETSLRNGFSRVEIYWAATGGELPVDSRDLDADRLASYTLLESLAAHGGVFGLMLAAGVSMVGWFRWGGLGRVLGKRMAAGLTAADWAWIAGLGVILPLIWHGFFTRVPAFHGRDIFFGAELADKLSASKLPDPVEYLVAPVFLDNSIGLAQCLGTLLFILTSVVWVAGWRVALRGRVLGFGGRRTGKWFGWTGPLAAALSLPATALPAIEFGRGGVPERGDLLPAAVLLGYAVLWLLVVLVRAAFLGRPDRGLERATVARVLVPAFLCAAIATGIAGRLAAAEHRRWLARDPLGVISEQYDGLTKYQFLTTRMMREKLLAAFREE